MARVNELRILMGMPITVEVVDEAATKDLLDSAFAYFEYVDRKFSTYKEDSEISRINRGEVSLEAASEDMKAIFALADETRDRTDGYFNMRHADAYDPSGVVKGWAIYHVSQLLRGRGARNFYIDAGGDIQTSGMNAQGHDWRVGIRNPFDPAQIVKVLSLTDCGIATSGTYIRGRHIYNPHNAADPLTEIVSITVIGPNICDADRFATAAFAMGRQGIFFIEGLPGFEGYMIDREGLATLTSGFERHVRND
ncbi:MAG TPA: FAD:protein FMN transferase [Anaerolineales bacterium]